MAQLTPFSSLSFADGLLALSLAFSMSSLLLLPISAYIDLMWLVARTAPLLVASELSLLNNVQIRSSIEAGASVVLCACSDVLMLCRRASSSWSRNVLVLRGCAVYCWSLPVLRVPTARFVVVS